jgi:hypothetical protein
LRKKRKRRKGPERKQPIGMGKRKQEIDRERMKIEGRRKREE